MASGAKADVLIIGGGLAGLAAGVDLASSGRRVLLLERRSFLGGRAYSFTDRVTGDTIDNGQHLMMGCYHRTLDFLGKIGTLDKIKFQDRPRVDFLLSGGEHAIFQCPPWPAPLHLLGGLMGLKSLTWRDRLRALRVGLALRWLDGRREELSDITVREWLTRHGQTEAMQRNFWDPMALATLNEHSERASADMFVRVLEEAFLRTKADSSMVIAKVGLSDLYAHDARRVMEKHGGEVRLGADVARIEFDARQATGVILRNGERIEAGAVISAVPYFALRRMLPAEIKQAHESLRRLDEMTSSPIVSTNLWYREPVTDLEFTSLLDSPIEWVFNKNAITGKTGPQHLALVISGAHSVTPLSKEALIAMAAAELRRFFPAARGQEPLHAFVMRERDATLSHTTGVNRLRPGQATAFENFYLAGDWTRTNLPATIEGAVWSGQECARLIIETQRSAKGLKRK